MRRITRVALYVAAAVCATGGQAEKQKLTAREVIERIQKNCGAPWQGQTVDTFKAGDPETPVAGIATTMMATFDVLQRAAARGLNLVITHEPTFYGHTDETSTYEKENDAVFAAKEAFIKEHHMVIWRFHDHWHMRKPDGIQEGMIRALGWEKYHSPDNDHVFTVPQTTVGQLASDIRRRLGIRTLRVVGDPAMKITKLALNPGYPGFPAERHTLQSDDVEALVMGEGLEWETIEYGADAVAEGKHKALIILGHIPSEQAGMEDCAQWLKTFVSEAPIEFVAAKEPFWSPK